MPDTTEHYGQDYILILNRAKQQHETYFYHKFKCDKLKVCPGAPPVENRHKQSSLFNICTVF